MLFQDNTFMEYTADDSELIMSIQYQLQAMESMSSVVIEDNRWSSSSKLRSPGRWLSDSSLSVNDKSQIRPPRRPNKDHDELQIKEDFRWKDNTSCDFAASHVPTKPIRRKSIGLTADDFQDICSPLSYSQVSRASNIQRSPQAPNITTASSA
jgi:hypothetical protein